MESIYKVHARGGKIILCHSMEEMTEQIKALGDDFIRTKKIVLKRQPNGSADTQDRLFIRFSTEQKAYLKTRAKELGLKGISEYIKILILVDREHQILTTSAQMTGKLYATEPD